MANTDLIEHDTAIIGRDTARFSVCKASKLKKIVSVWQKILGLAPVQILVMLIQLRPIPILEEGHSKLLEAESPFLITGDINWRGITMGTLAADGMPKWVIQVNLVTWTQYEIITHHPRDIPPEYGVTGKTVFGGISYPSRAYYRKK